MKDSTLIDVLLVAAITIIVFVLAVAVVVRTTDNKMTIEPGESRMTYKIDKHHTNVISKGWAIRDEDGSAVAYVLGTDEGEAETLKRLIAAAPDLLAALEEVVAISDRQHDAWDRAKAAISAAKGEKL